MKKTKLTRSLLAAVSIVALSAVMYGCVHDGDGDDTPPVVEPEPPTAYEAGKAAIMAATTAEAAQAAYDAVDQTAISGQEAASLQAALASQLMTLATMAREAAQKMALMTAAGMIDTSDEALSTQEGVDAARTAIATLRGALAAAADVSEADKAMYVSMLDGAVMAVDMAQGGIDTATRRMNQMTALSDASDDLQAALAAFSGSTPTQAQLDAANEALGALNTAIMAGADLTDDEKAPYQREAGNAAGPIDMAQAVIDNAEDAAETEAKKQARADARKVFNAIERDREFDNTGGKATHLRLTRNVKGPASGLIVNPLSLALTQGIDPDASNQISATATENDKGVESNSNTYLPTVGGIPVTEMLPDLAGWKGNRYVSEHPDDPLTCEYAEGCMKGITDHLVIYTNQADAKDAESETFAERYGADSNNDGTRDNAWYMPESPTAKAHITTAGLTAADVVANWVLIASPEFSTAGRKTHTMEDDPDTKDMDESMVSVMGTFDGVSGTYTCAGTGADVCVSSRLVGDSEASTPEDGVAYVRLGGGGLAGWTFTPDDPNAMTTLGDPTAAAMFVTYGYWMRELSGDDGWTDVRPFSELRTNAVPHANGVAQAIKGSASYSGGAAGMYAIYHPVAAGSSSGHWTANAMLTADFDEQMVSGELTGFMAEGQAMDWKVELLEAKINAADPAPDPASRGRAGDTSGFQLDGSGHGFANAENGTVWTMGDMDGEKTGSWYGDFWAANDGTVDATAANNPAPAAATGVFWAEHGDVGRMTGAFGVERDDN